MPLSAIGILISTVGYCIEWLAIAIMIDEWNMPPTHGIARRVLTWSAYAHLVCTIYILSPLKQMSASEIDYLEANNGESMSRTGASLISTLMAAFRSHAVYCLTPQIRSQLSCCHLCIVFNAIFPLAFGPVYGSLVKGSFPIGFPLVFLDSAPSYVYYHMFSWTYLVIDTMFIVFVKQYIEFITDTVTLSK